VKPERIAEFNQQVESEYARNKAGVYPENFPRHMEIPVGRYVDPAFYELEKKYLWSRVWLIAGHVDEFPEVGSFKQWNLAGDPVLLVRGKDNVVRAFFNSCRHRGAGVIREEKGTAKVLACKFHAWTYDLQGRLIFVPEESDFPDLDKQDISLIPLRCELFGNLIFINRDLNAPPLSQYLGKGMSELAHFEFESLSLGAILTYDLKCNWKTAMEAFLEAYHVDTTHPQTVAPFLDSRGVTFEMWGYSSLMVLPNHRNVEFPYSTSISTDPRHELTRASSMNFDVFPNLHIPLTEFSFPLMVFWPTGINTCRSQVIFMEPPDNPRPTAEQEKAVYQQVDQVMLEDFGNVESQQQTNESGILKSLRIGYREWRLYRWHELIDQTIGQENIPPALRIPVLIGDRVRGL
jgi:phenylpropionate dioxygenase-like ring-hydroxylating dioxygenase large terminal subunit